MTERFSPNPEHRQFAGSDIRTLTDVTFEAYNSKSSVTNAILIPVLVTPDMLPPGLTRNNLNSADDSTRSRLAQLGLSARAGTLKHILTDWEWKGNSGSVTSPFETTILVDSFCANPVRIEKDTGIVQVIDHGPTITGKELTSRINYRNSPVGITGTYDKDWKYIFANGNNDENSVVGIFMRIDPDSRKWIPPHAGRIITMKGDSDFDYRPYINMHLRHIPQTEDKILWIGQTVSQLHLNGNIYAMLDEAVVSDVSKKDLEKDGTHINARLLEGKTNGQIKTHWEVRVEVLSPTVEGKIPNWIAVFFGKS